MIETIVRISSISIVAIILVVGTNHAESIWKKQPPRQDPAQESAAAVNQSVYTPTYLDSLNKGREAVLSEKDFAGAAPVVVALSSAPAAAPSETSDQFTGFRIQCFASGQIETIRAEKKNLEAKVKNPLYIVFSSPYYKLMAGDFTSRADADTMVPDLKAMGYPDAWVVAGKPAAKQ